MFFKFLFFVVRAGSEVIIGRFGVVSITVITIGPAF